ncbi:hypothetical protein DL93DRAFT_2081290, partial [Clavulina sp. PMI_390]
MRFLEQLPGANQQAYLNPLTLATFVVVGSVFMQYMDWYPRDNVSIPYIGYLAPAPAFASVAVALLAGIDWIQRPYFEKQIRQTLFAEDILSIPPYYQQIKASLTLSKLSRFSVLEWKERPIGYIAIDAAMPARVHPNMEDSGLLAEIERERKELQAWKKDEEAKAKAKALAEQKADNANADTAEASSTSSPARNTRSRSKNSSSNSSSNIYSTPATRPPPPQPYTQKAQELFAAPPTYMSSRPSASDLPSYAVIRHYHVDRLYQTAGIQYDLIREVLSEFFAASAASSSSTKGQKLDRVLIKVSNLRPTEEKTWRHVGFVDLPFTSASFPPELGVPAPSFDTLYPNPTPAAKEADKNPPFTLDLAWANFGSGARGGARKVKGSKVIYGEFERWLEMTAERWAKLEALDRARLAKEDEEAEA